MKVLQEMAGSDGTVSESEYFVNPRGISAENIDQDRQ